MGKKFSSLRNSHLHPPELLPLHLKDPPELLPSPPELLPPLYSHTACVVFKKMGMNFQHFFWYPELLPPPRTIATPIPPLAFYIWISKGLFLIQFSKHIWRMGHNSSSMDNRTPTPHLLTPLSPLSRHWCVCGACLRQGSTTPKSGLHLTS